MSKSLIAALACTLLLGACAYSPTREDEIKIVDSPADVVTCRRLGAVSGVVATGPDFEPKVEAMVAQTVALGGTDLFLARLSRDWAAVRGVAYRCPNRRSLLAPVVRSQTIVRAKG